MRIRILRLTVCLVTALLVAGCSNVPVAPPELDADASIARGEYLTVLLGCGQCHTDGALSGRVQGRWLAGSLTGIAHTADADGANPGIVFPKNLTPDPETGLGNWSKTAIVNAIRRGVDEQGHWVSSVMPWMNYRLITKPDLESIADYLLSLPPTRQAVPNAIQPGEPVTAPYIRIGLYTFDPEGNLEGTRDPAANR